MKAYLTSFASGEFKLSLNALCESAIRSGVDETRRLGSEPLRKTDFYQEHRALLYQPPALDTGFGGHTLLRGWWTRSMSTTY
jgi:hypothetical protein